MQEVNQQNLYVSHRKPDNKLLPVIVILLVIGLLGIVFWGILGEGFAEFKKYYIIPWVLMSAVIIAAPSIYLIYKKQFSLYHPLVYAAFSYFAPAFVLGGLILSSGYSDPYFLSHIKDPEYNFPLTYIIVMLGFGGLTVGFFLPFGRILGEKVRKILPTPNWKDENVYFPGLILLACGILTTTFAYVVGVLGFQVAEQIGTYDGLIFLTTLFWLEASFLLWLLLFRRGKFDILSVFIGGIVISGSIVKSLYAGNRGSLIQVVIMVTLAYVLAGRKIKLKQGFSIAGFMIVAITLGMIYGTTFRNVKQSESRVSIDQYTEIIFETFGTIGRRDNLKVLESGIESLAYRIVETGSSLAVVVSKYEDLRPYEEGYDLDNNIYKDSVTTFIPRFIWKDKPVASDPRLYSELYFDYGESSFAITPMGDLIRNFGIIGVPLGMIFLGIILSFIYESLIKDQRFSVWRTTLYYMLLTTVSYEGFYGTIIPFLIKFGSVAVVGLIVINLFIKKPNQQMLIKNEFIK